MIAIINQKPTEFKTMEPEVQKCDLFLILGLIYVCFIDIID